MTPEEMIKLLRESYYFTRSERMDIADAFEAYIAREAKLRGALEARIADYCDYMTTNNLGDPERQQLIKFARQALAETEAKDEPASSAP